MKHSAPFKIFILVQFTRQTQMNQTFQHSLSSNYCPVIYLTRTAPQPCQFYIPWIHKDAQTKIPHKHLFVRFAHFRYMHTCAVWFLLPHSLWSTLLLLISLAVSLPILLPSTHSSFCYNIKVFAGFLFSNTDEDAHHECRHFQWETSPASCRLSVPGWLTIDMGLR